MPEEREERDHEVCVVYAALTPTYHGHVRLSRVPFIPRGKEAVRKREEERLQIFQREKKEEEDGGGSLSLLPHSPFSFGVL